MENELVINDYLVQINLANNELYKLRMMLEKINPAICLDILAIQEQLSSLRLEVGDYKVTDSTIN